MRCVVHHGGNDPPSLGSFEQLRRGQQTDGINVGTTHVYYSEAEIILKLPVIPAVFCWGSRSQGQERPVVNSQAHSFQV